MRRLIALPICVLVGLSLAGCSAPLTTKDVSASVTIDQTTDVIIGDVTKVNATGTLAKSRTDKIDVSLDSSADGSTWKTLTEKQTVGPTFAIDSTETQETEGHVTYRVTVSEIGKKATPLFSAESSPVAVVDLKPLVRAFYYDATNAYATTSAAGMDWEKKHNSPEIDQTLPGWAESTADLLAANYTENTVPDLTTISPDPKWTLPATKCNPAATAPPKGRTFIVSVTSSYTYNGYPNAATKADVHVTLLNGKLYDYRSCT